MRVVDASVLVAVAADSGHDGRWAAGQIAGRNLASTGAVLAESFNALRRMEQAGRVSGADASSACRDLLRLEIELFRFDPFARRVWALRRNLTSSDAWYVAVAESLDCPLVTLDRRLSRAAGPACAFITPPPA